MCFVRPAIVEHDATYGITVTLSRKTQAKTYIINITHA